MLVDSPDLMVRINFSSVYLCTNSIFVELLFTAVQMPACSVVYTLVCVKLIGFNISNIVCTLCIALFYIVVLFFLRCLRPFILISGDGYRILVLSSIWRNIVGFNNSNINSYCLSVSQVCVCIFCLSFLLCITCAVRYKLLAADVV